ncbi:hypothetical protein [Leucobacter denitrificans]|uniref:Uncharacterized protein n=1 Tax=Leucobacter denitrificans TaxID=683042 RepID=A0A7G9S2E1_9MICO|nr:hypothetical protein [Leucobacter denitrificans]QNN62016.1 hypothetical protein H9L06_06740 [Leucobacter denitrificans]
MTPDFRLTLTAQTDAHFPRSLRTCTAQTEAHGKGPNPQKILGDPHRVTWESPRRW